MTRRIEITSDLSDRFSLVFEETRGVFSAFVIVPCWNHLSSSAQENIRDLLDKVDVSEMKTDPSDSNSSYQNTLGEDFDQQGYLDTVEHLAHHSSPKLKAKLYLLSIAADMVLSIDMMDIFLANINEDEIVFLHDERGVLVGQSYSQVTSERMSPKNSRAIYSMDNWGNDKVGELKLVDAYENIASTLFKEKKPLSNYRASNDVSLDSHYIIIHRDLLVFAGLYGDELFAELVKGTYEADGNFAYLNGIGQAAHNDVLLYSMFIFENNISVGEFLTMYDRAVSVGQDYAEFYRVFSQRQDIYESKTSFSRKLGFLLFLLLDKDESMIDDVVVPVSNLLCPYGLTKIKHGDDYGINLLSALREFKSLSNTIPFSLVCSMYGLDV